MTIAIGRRKFLPGSRISGVMRYAIMESVMDENAGQKNSPAYRLAALDSEFLLGDSMRGVRLQLEYEKAEERLLAWVVRSTIVVFGSARAGGSGDETVSTAPPGSGAAPRRPIGAVV
jgi:hypothetical protein